MTQTQIWLYVLIPMVIGTGVAVACPQFIDALAGTAQVVLGALVGLSGFAAYLFVQLNSSES